VSNAERVSAILAPAFRGGAAEIDEALIERMVAAAGPAVTDDFVVMMSGAEGFEREFEGVAGLREAWRDWLGTFDRVTFEVEAVEEHGDNVLFLVRQRGVTRHGQVEIEQPSASVWKLRNDRVYRLEFHLDRRRALRSAQSGQE
jgi:ketosteroid isomerase-like protein